MSFGRELACGDAGLKYMLDRAVNLEFAEKIEGWLRQEIQRINPTGEYNVLLSVREAKGAVGEYPNNVPWKYDGVHLALVIEDDKPLKADETDRWAMIFVKLNDEGKFDDTFRIQTYGDNEIH